MPLLDHFHPPLSGTRHWESFHARWASALADRFNVDLLPVGYFAEIQAHVGGRMEVDLGTFESELPARPGPARGRGQEEGSSSVATLAAPPEVWTPPEPDIQFPAVFPDVIEMLVFNSQTGPTLVGAVEFVSPGNKDRPEARRAFAARCASYLQEGIGLAVVDIVTSLRANLHDELIELLDLGDAYKMSDASGVYASAYRPIRRTPLEANDAWLFRFAVGEPLPTVPLTLRAGPCLPLELEATYAEVCRRSRLA
jgi:hypothetical protein